MVASNKSRKIVLECLCIMLRPILTFCLRHSIGLPDVVECCKIVLVQLSEEQMRDGGTDVSISRLSVMSGVTRREVTRIYREKQSKEEPLSLPTKIIGQWQHDSRFITLSGKPRVLSAEGRDSEFSQLVRSVSADLNPYTVLFELERIGAVQRTLNGVKLAKPVYGPSGELKEGAKMIALDAGDLMAAIEENYARAEGETPNYHIVTEYDNITVEAIPELKRWVIEHGAKFHKKVRTHFSKFDKDLNPELKDKQGGVRLVFGGFSRVKYAREGVLQ